MNGNVEMKKLVLFGAIDRYNYGDNLMPILFSMFIDKYRPELKKDFELEYVAISKADLSSLGCLKCESISSLTFTLTDGSAVIVIGGEVLCGRNSTLFMHMQKSKTMHKFFRFIKKLAGKYFSLFSDRVYGTQWEFPFLLSPDFFKGDVKIIYNTVGGHINLAEKEKEDVLLRLNKASFVSYRDSRTGHNLSELTSEKALSPDSAFIMSDVVDEHFLIDNVKPSLIEICKGDYFVYQASPHKVDEAIKLVAKNLMQMSKTYNKKIILLPIGYASGHDDYEYLEQLEKYLESEYHLLYPLNVWEIMYVIKNCDFFIGTSLHGVITAMSFSKPHFGLNPQILKLDSFLKDWSIEPFNRCMNTTSVIQSLKNIDDSCLENLSDLSKDINKRVIDNNNHTLDIISGLNS